VASTDVARVIRAPGRIVVGPSDLSAAYPHGGTEIGLTRACVLQPVGSAFEVVSEGLAGGVTDVLEPAHEYVFSCFVRGWSDAAVSRFFRDHYVAGSASGHARYSAPSPPHGSSALGYALTLLFVPDDSIHVPAIIVYRGVPDWSESAEVAFQRGDELGLPLAFDCLRSDAGKILEVGMLADLSVS